jgi:hypothetical protein
MEGRTRKFVALCGVLMLFSVFITMFLIFIAAYSSPNKSVLVHINMFNEANLELVLLGAITLIGFYSIVHITKDILGHEIELEYQKLRNTLKSS